MGRTIGKSSIEVMRKRFPDKASEIETYADAFDVLAEEVNKGGGESELPAVTGVDNGKLLGVTGGEWGKVDAPASFAPYAVSGTFGTDANEKETITLNKTAAELYTAVSAGVMCKVTVTVTVQETTITTEVITAVVAARTEYNETIEYNFSLVGADGKQFAVEELSGGDTVVLTEM